MMSVCLRVHVSICLCVHHVYVLVRVCVSSPAPSCYGCPPGAGPVCVQPPSSRAALIGWRWSAPCSHWSV